MKTLIACALCLIIFYLPVPSQETGGFPEDFALVVRETRLFAGLEPYAEILGKAEPGQFFPVLSLSEDEYGIQWAEVELPDGQNVYLSDVIILREKEAELRRLIEKVNLADISMWDDETLLEVQRRGVEVGFDTTQVLFAKGLPLSERKIDTREEWFYRRLVILIEDDKVIGFTEVLRLPQDKSISIDLTADDPEFETPSGRWETLAFTGSGQPAADAQVTRAGAASASAPPVATITVKKTNGVDASGVFRVPVPAKGLYRISARWLADKDNSAKVFYRVMQQRRELAVMQANQRLYSNRTVFLGDLEVDDSAPMVIRITSSDGKPFNVVSLSIEYLNKPIRPSVEPSAGARSGNATAN
jgi:hypothetical protein